MNVPVAEHLVPSGSPRHAFASDAQRIALRNAVFVDELVTAVASHCGLTFAKDADAVPEKPWVPFVVVRGPDEHVRPGKFEDAIEVPASAAVLRNPQISDARIAGRVGPTNLRCLVGRTVIRDGELEVIELLREQCRQRLLQVSSAVVYREADGNGGSIRGERRPFARYVMWVGHRGFDRASVEIDVWSLFTCVGIAHDDLSARVVPCQLSRARFAWMRHRTGKVEQERSIAAIGMRALPLMLVAAVVGCNTREASRSSLVEDSASAPLASASADAPARTSPPPPYDLAADLASRLDGARRELGRQTASDVERGVFLLVSPRQDAVFEASVRLARRALDAYFKDRFSTSPSRAVTAYIFPAKAPYDAFCEAHFHEPCESKFGFYQPAASEIVVNAAFGISTLTHELVHPIVRNDFPGVPQWLNEGLASLFEMPVFPRAGEIHGAKNWRLPRLRAALGSQVKRTKAGLDALFAMSDDDFHADEELHHAMARYACQWLDERGHLWPFYHAWRDAVSGDRSGEKAFARVVGKTPAEANDQWVRWVQAL
jgi:hypothetical protein